MYCVFICLTADKLRALEKSSINNAKEKDVRE